MFRAIREIQPPWVVVENVPGLITSSKGMVFEQICTDLEAKGYEVTPFVLPSCGVDAPHRRERVWIIAYSDRNRLRKRAYEQEQIGRCCGTSYNSTSSTDGFTANANCYKRYTRIKLTKQYRQTAFADDRSSIAHADVKRLERRNRLESSPSDIARCDFSAFTDPLLCRRQQNNKDEQSRELKQDIPDWRHFPTQPPVCRGDDGVSNLLDPSAVFEGVKQGRK
jgi:DNA (cytosine-5)-methyltransferase 1